MNRQEVIEALRQITAESDQARRGDMLTALAEAGAPRATAEAIERLEDAGLNAIADTRQVGPFVSVTLEDL